MNSTLQSGLTATLVLGLFAFGSAPACARASVHAATQPDDQRVAWGNDLELTRSKLDPVLVDRYAMTGQGRSALDHLLKTKLLERMAVERRLEVSDKELDARIAVLDQQLRDSGIVDGIRGQMRESGVEESEFRKLFRISIVQEKLCREALGIPPEGELTGGQQELWIEEVMSSRGLSGPTPPWSDGVAGRCGDVAVSAAEYQEKLLFNLDPEQVRETCYQILLVEGIRARMPDLSPKRLAKAIDVEIERRRRRAESNPAYQGAKFEDLLSTQGTTIEQLKRDPAVVVTALSELWILRRYTDDDLRKAYNDERFLFDSSFGEAVRTRVIFLRAAEVSTAANPRLYDQAFAQLEELARGISSEDDFQTAARRHSEDSQTRTENGELGWLRRVGDGLPELRGSVFGNLKTGGPLPPGGRLLPPVRNENGVVLAWMAEYQPAPTWKDMRERVRNELRARFITEVLPRESLVTILDR